MAPSIFTKEPSEGVSKHYTHIPTIKVIDDMKTLGWGVNEVKQVKSRVGIGFQKHLVIFRNEDIVITGEDGDDVFPQILLTNSHDGKNAFTFTPGLFRLICSNGLVIATEKFGDVKIRHMGYSFEELQKEIHEMVENLPLTVESMNRMKQAELNQDQIVKFAKEALEIRFKKDDLKRISINYMDLVDPVRKEDKGNDLWRVFNIVQEKLIEGDFQYIAGTKVRKARKIKNFNQDIKVNTDLFALAMSYVKN